MNLDTSLKDEICRYAALNDIEKRAVVAEIKRQRRKLNPTELAEKTAILGKELTNYSVSHICLSMEDM